MSENTWLIDWIHKVEYDIRLKKPTKRRPSLVTEIYFQNNLSRAAALKIPPDIVFGWMKTANKNGVTRWYKISSGDNEVQKKVSLNFIRTVLESNPSDEFYLVNYKVEQPAGLTCPPMISITAKNLYINGDRAVKQGANSIEFSSLINEEIKKHTLIESDNEIKPWLENLDVASLKRLLATRCLMNFAKLYLTDIDGVYFDASGKLTFLEFKRKNAAKGTIYELIEHPSLWKYLQTAKKLNSEARKSGNNGGVSTTETFSPASELKNTNEWKKIIPGNNEYFGLDTSHAENVQLCNKNDWVYRYVIWNHASASASELFNIPLSAKSNLDLRCINVESKHIAGISWANNEKSGTYSSGIFRHQLMINTSDFNKVDLPPTLELSTL